MEASESWTNKIAFQNCSWDGKLDLQDYWSSDKVLKTLWFKTMMNRDQFLLIVRMIHFNHKIFTFLQVNQDTLFFKNHPIYDSVQEIIFHLLHKNDKEKPVLHRKFCLDLVKDLILLSNTETIPDLYLVLLVEFQDTPRTSPHLTRRYFPSLITPKFGAKKQRSTRISKACQSYDKSAETYYMCKDCGYTPLWLCHTTF